MGDFQDKNILIIGLGISGYAAAAFLKGKDAAVTVTDMAQEKALEPLASKIRDMGIPMELGGHRRETIQNSDMIILSPGVPHTIEPVQRAVDMGIPVIGEIELAARFIKEPIIAVTGTNGKTTTTRLIGEMLTSCGYKVFVGGNIGRPLIEYADQKEKSDFVIAEVSSFQLDTVDLFKPRVGVLLNVSEDHLDRYSDMRQYAMAKLRLFENQDDSDIAVLNGSDSLTRSLDGQINSRKQYFDSSGEADTSAVINKDAIFLKGVTGNDAGTIDLTRTSLVGKHNHENIAAAALAALAAGGDIHGIQTALSGFTGLSHRLEYAVTIDGVDYFDDSKATNVDAVSRALGAFSGPVILIMGGRDKGGDYGILESQVKEQIKLLIIMGEAGEKIDRSLGHLTRTCVVETMEQAVAAAREAGEPGDTVLLSPACSSFDMFDSYAHRGDVFCRLVGGLEGNE
jgi:UDP-N-acetylmuramoylalanine--D-glutamate ligase